MAASRRITERRLVLVVGAVVFVDTMFYAAIAPLLPTLAHELHLSKLSAGVLTASYPLGTLIGSLPGGWLAVRAGPKFTVCAGLALLASSTLAFGLLDSAPALDAARFVEGIGGACSWAGGLAWIVAQAPSGRRGALMGAALGAGIGGALFGPVIGTVANAIGRAATFSGVVVVALGLMVQARSLSAPAPARERGLGQLRGGLRDTRVLTGMWLIALAAVGSGMVSVLAPLRLHRLGASVVAIGATFLVATGFETALAPTIGHLSDRRGRLAPLRFGLAAVAVALACFTLPRTAALLALVVVVLVSGLGVLWAPAMAVLSEGAEGCGIDQGFAAALINLAWAGGQILGAGAGGAVAKSTGDGVPVAVAAGVCMATAVVLARPALSSVGRPARPAAPVVGNPQPDAGVD